MSIIQGKRNCSAMVRAIRWATRGGEVETTRSMLCSFTTFFVAATAGWYHPICRSGKVSQEMICDFQERLTDGRSLETEEVCAVVAWSAVSRGDGEPRRRGEVIFSTWSKREGRTV